MFGGSRRRNKTRSKPLTRETANPNAATAAASAFMRRDTQPPSLSSAAAAAALRSRPQTPTNVAEVQSRRVGRRSASVSSSFSRGRRPDLRRTPSNSSMTERTFRSPSPASGRSPLPDRYDVPPVPSLPKNEEDRGRQQVARTQPPRRALSVQTQPFKTASQKMQDGRGASWYGAAATQDLSNVRRPDAARHNPALLDDRSGSISPSINFSYPRGILESPTGNRPGSSMEDQTLVYDANSRRMVPQGELRAKQSALDERQRVVQAASEKPVKKRQQDLNRSGSHLSKGTVARTQVAAVQEPMSSTSSPKQMSSPKPVSSPTPASAPKPPTTRAPPAQDTPMQSIEHDPAPLNDPISPIEPSQVAVDELELPASATKVSTPDPTAFNRATNGDTTQQAGTPNIRTTAAPRPVSMSALQQSARTRDAQSVSPSPSSHRRSESVRHSRVQSESPARTAHFAPSTSHLVVKHEPPPRSLSPRKSALKHGSSRAASPSDDGSELSVSRSREGSLPRKKAARVSFNEHDIVVGQAAGQESAPASPVVPSPQVKKSWHNIIGRRRKDDIAVEEDEKMSPRPALPAFGSVREKKHREQDERPLVRPSERSFAAPPTSSDKADTPLSDLGPSQDHAVGALLAQDGESRQQATNEPLPPIVTSVDHNGYISNSSLSSDEEEEPKTQQSFAPGPQRSADDDFTPETTQEVEPATVITNSPPNGNSVAGKEAGDQKPTDVTEIEMEHGSEALPSIAVSQSTPITEEEEEVETTSSPKKEYFAVPGGFPDDSPDSSPTQATFHDSYETVPAAAKNAKRPDPITPVKAHEVESSQPSPPMDKIQEEREDESGTDDSAVFSDAYEDLSDMEDGEGFMSLDAIVSTPLKTKVLHKASEQAALDKGSPTESLKAPEPVAHKPADDWEQAKAYWKSLTTDKRRQLEIEALEEAGDEADGESVQKPKKTKKRRSLDNAGAVVQAHRHPDRTYQIQPGTKWAEEKTQTSQASKGTGGGKLQKSVRGAPPVSTESEPKEGAMKKSLRRSDPVPAAEGGESTGESPISKTMRGRQNGQAGRPASYQPQSALELARLQYNTAQNQKNNSRNPGPDSALRRRGSDSSQSSFRRARSGSNPTASFGFRSSMRGGAAHEQPPAQPAPEQSRSSRFSIRSLSPAPFRRSSMATSPPPPAMGNRMKQSMRSSGNSSDGSSRINVFGRTSSQKPKKGPRANGASRFEDSSDEDDPMPTLRSRFADSSDEDEPAPRPKSRGGFAKSMRKSQPGPRAPEVPTGPIRSTSPDLPDSDDNGEPAQPPASRALGSGTMRRNHTNHGAAGDLGTPSPRSGQQRRGSFMSSILGRKKDGSNGKITRNVSESAARRDTPLERSTEQLTVMRTNSGGGRLQKKGGGGADAPGSGNWPFPEDETQRQTAAGDEPARPATSAGPDPAATNRPGVLRRRTVSSQQVGPDDASAATGSPAKKKKFGALRKMFGIHG